MGEKNRGDEQKRMRTAAEIRQIRPIKKDLRAYSPGLSFLSVGG